MRLFIRFIDKVFQSAAVEICGLLRNCRSVNRHLNREETSVAMDAGVCRTCRNIFLVYHLIMTNFLIDSAYNKGHIGELVHEKP